VQQALYDRRSRAGTSDVWHCGGSGRGRGRLHHDERDCWGRSDTRGTFRSMGATLSAGEPRFASVAVRWPRRASSLEGPGDCAAIDGTFGLSCTGGMIAPTEVSCPRRMMVILQLRTAARAQLPRKRV